MARDFYTFICIDNESHCRSCIVEYIHFFLTFLFAAPEKENMQPTPNRARFRNHEILISKPCKLITITLFIYIIIRVYVYHRYLVHVRHTAKR